MVDQPIDKEQSEVAGQPRKSATTPETRSIFSLTLMLLTLVYAFNFIDRYIMVVMQEAIKVDLGLQDWQLGTLVGFAFALFYTILGIPIAWLADRSNRKVIITVALTIWSGMTAVCGLAQNFTQLALARLGVGVGEAGGSPPAHSMISDMYDEKRRATALAIYSAGLYIGVMVGFSVGGFLLQNFGWRTTFLLVGAPGVLLALLLFVFGREPARQQAAGALADKPGFMQTLNTVRRLKSFRWFSLACAMSAFVSYGIGGFNGSFVVRYFGLSPIETGLVLSLTNGFAGIIGTFLGGWLADRFAKNDIRWYLWFPGLTAVLAIPIYLFAYNTGSIYFMIPSMFIAVILGTTYLAPSIAIAHRLVDPRMRAMTSAILFFVLNLIGLGLGPTFVGALSDILRELRGEESLRLAITLMLSFVLVKGYLFYRGGKALPEDLAAKAD